MILRDNFDRVIDCARISITPRCNLRCVYCRPAAACPPVSHDCHPRTGSGDLTFDEIVTAAESFARLGVTKIRISGGEPLLRPGVPELVARLKNIPGVNTVALTTNGQMLEPRAAELAAAGLDRINVSVDSADPVTYKKVSGGGELARTLAGVDAAVKAGIKTIKLNAVLIDPDHVKDAAALALLAKEKNVGVRFIELMPLGAAAAFPGVPNAVVRAYLETRFGRWTPNAVQENSPAVTGTFAGFAGNVGFISPLSEKFCDRCGRVRLDSSGVLRGCLCGGEGADLRPLLRPLLGGGVTALDNAVVNVIAAKPRGHDLSHRAKPETRMYEIGG